jgi:hypothetical protein
VQNLAKKMKIRLANQDPVPFNPLDPGTGMNLLWILDPGSMGLEKTTYCCSKKHMSKKCGGKSSWISKTVKYTKVCITVQKSTF